jgi:hypothetical protein
MTWVMEDFKELLLIWLNVTNSYIFSQSSYKLDKLSEALDNRIQCPGVGKTD